MEGKFVKKLIIGVGDDYSVLQSTKNKSKEFYNRFFVVKLFLYFSFFHFSSSSMSFQCVELFSFCFLFRIIGKTIKALFFHNTTHIFARSGKSRCLFQNPVKHRK